MTILPSTRIMKNPTTRDQRQARALQGVRRVTDERALLGVNSMILQGMGWPCVVDVRCSALPLSECPLCYSFSGRSFGCLTHIQLFTARTRGNQATGTPHPLD